MSAFLLAGVRVGGKHNFFAVLLRRPFERRRRFAPMKSIGEGQSPYPIHLPVFEDVRVEVKNDRQRLAFHRLQVLLSKAETLHLGYVTTGLQRRNIEGCRAHSRLLGEIPYNVSGFQSLSQSQLRLLSCGKKLPWKIGRDVGVETYHKRAAGVGRRSCRSPADTLRRPSVSGYLTKKPVQRHARETQSDHARSPHTKSQGDSPATPKLLATSFRMLQARHNAYPPTRTRTRA